MNKQVKALMEDIIDDYIRDSVEDIWFPDLIDELSYYGTRNTDRVFAFGMCLLHNIDNYRMRVKEKEETEDIGFKYLKIGDNGVPYVIN
jgi:hypothetical protein